MSSDSPYLPILHGEVQSLVLHHHNRVTELAKLFGTWVVLSGTASVSLPFYPLDSSSQFVVAGIVALFTAWLAKLGMKAITLERSYLAYFLVLRQKIDWVLGWNMTYPPQVQLVGPVTGVVRIGDANFTMRTGELGSASDELALSDKDRDRIRAIALDLVGLYGAYMGMFLVVRRSLRLVAIFLFGLWVHTNAPILLSWLTTAMNANAIAGH